MNLKISFVIPTFNEEGNIGALITSIQKHVDEIEYEIIVVDNLSQDSTVVEAGRYNAYVCSSAGNVGALRNQGALKANGDILVFLDADMEITDLWGRNILKKSVGLIQKRNLITGSVADIYNQKNWIEKFWFKPRVSVEDVNYINSGHLIVLKEIFFEIGGFDGSLKTGEDYDFCQRAKSSGCMIENSPVLRVIHKGYPKNIAAFFKREIWHGKGDCQSLNKLFASKPACVSILVLVLGVVCASLSFYWQTFWPISVFMVLFWFLCLLASYVKVNTINSGFFVNSFLYGVYFVARGFSAFNVLAFRMKKSL